MPSVLAGDSPNSEASDHLILLVHGIRTSASWAEMVRDELQRDSTVIVKPVRYGFIDSFSFLLPGPTRTVAIRRVMRELRNARRFHPNARLSVVAHSFGTYAIGRTLAKEGDIALFRLILCGSVLKREFQWELARERVQEGPVNDCGTLDIWPLLASAITWGYGPSGVFGFQSILVENRFHLLRHSDFFTAEFVRKFWRPFLLHGDVARPEYERQRPPPHLLREILPKVPLRWMFAAVFALLAAFILSTAWERFSSQRLTEAKFGRVEKIEGVPLVPEPHPNALFCVSRWLAAALNAQYTIDLGLKNGVDKDDYFATVVDESKVRRLPQGRVGNLQNESTALLRVIDAYPEMSIATIESWSYDEALQRGYERSGKDSLTCVEAPQWIAPVKITQLVVQIPRQEKDLFYSIHGGERDSSSSDTERERDNRDVISKVDAYLTVYPNGFFAGDALFIKARAYEALGEDAKARATFDQFLHDFPFHPSSGAARDSLF